jgi:NitT/TauT family transport system ATP-binding protein
VPAPLCELRHVSQEFPQPRGRPLPVLEDVSLDVRPEEVVALVGPSGCGKSTVLRVIAGLTVPTRGEVLYHGRPLRGLNPGVGFVFQGFALFPWMTVAENVRAVLRPRGLARTELEERVASAVQLVGLSGFEEAYPRELSGGMKQRLGIARALSLEPEILLMDEPFSQVDALTAESLRAEVIDIWSARRHRTSSIVIVSHDIHEAAWMADRIVVLAARPGRVRTVVEAPLPRPRDYRSREFLHLVDDLHDVITGHEMPDAPPRALPEGLFEPLPHVQPGEVAGLLEYLDARGGREDVFRIAAETRREYGALIRTVTAAELLGFVDTPRRAVVLEPEGLRFVRADPAHRKAIWRERIVGLQLFRAVRDRIHAEGGALGRAEVLDLIAAHMPAEDHEAVFATLAGWGRFGDLFAHDRRRHRLSLAAAG